MKMAFIKHLKKRAPVKDLFIHQDPNLSCVTVWKKKDGVQYLPDDICGGDYMILGINRVELEYDKDDTKRPANMLENASKEEKLNRTPPDDGGSRGTKFFANYA